MDLGCLPKPHPSTLNQAKNAAALMEEILDEFPNKSILPHAHENLVKASDISMDQRSFLKLQMELNQSSHIDDTANQVMLAL